jgi:hypothetical protein
MFELKKKLMIVSTVLMLCSLLLIVNLGTTKAHEPGYDYVEYDAIRTPTLDGTWTASDEWTDAQQLIINPNAIWRTKTVRTGFYQYILVEIFNDTTNDPADNWVVCIDSAHNGGTTPQTDDILIRILGHTTLEVYVGNGATWQRDMGANWGISWDDGFVSTPLNSTPHWILEIRWEMDGWLILGQPPHGMFVAESNGGVSYVSWPPTGQTAENNPSKWGTMTAYTGTTIPEGFSLVAIVMLSSAAAIVGFRYLRKHPKTKTPTTIKL